MMLFQIFMKFAAFTLLFLVTHTAFSLTNGGFESGDFSGWLTAGDVVTDNGSFGGGGPTEGEVQALLTTVSDLDLDTYAGDGSPGLSFIDAISADELEIFLGLAPGELHALTGKNVIEGSAIMQSFSLNAGDSITFDWNFLTDEPSSNFESDLALVTVDGVLTVLADRNSLLHSTGGIFLNDTGFSSFFHDFTSSGTHTIAFVIVDVDNTVGASGLLVDNISIVAAVLPLEGRLPATPGGDDYQAYYDPNLDITWAADANINDRDNWDNQMAWAAGLTLGGESGWRLPNADVNGDNTVIDCSGGGVENCADNEMGFLFWEEGITAAAPGPFSDVQAFVYWSGTEFGSSNVWAISFFSGGQGLNHTDNTFPAWAVHDGDVTTDDSDSDGIVDLEDNCIEVPNGPLIPDAGGNSQVDTDGDGYGNLCDGDLNNDGSTNTLDLNLYKQAHRSAVGDANYDVDADFNGDGQINTLDLNIYKGLHRKPPGPSCCAP
jgi:hypothetical protein